MARVLLLLVLSLLGAGGPALAQSHFKDAVKSAVAGSTLDEVIAWSDAQFARAATIGRYVRWGGTILLGSALIAAGLDYFYNYLRRETGTSLDQWVNWSGGVPEPVWSGRSEPDNAAYIASAIGQRCGVQYGVYPTVWVFGDNTNGYGYKTFVSNGSYQGFTQNSFLALP
jgi:hypothetical protein